MASSKNFKTMKLISQVPRERRLMVRCLELYYRQARSQKEIARALGVSAATVSRLLKRAYDDGFVRVELDLPRAEELEAGLTELRGLPDAVVVAAGGRGDRSCATPRSGRSTRPRRRWTSRSSASA